MLTEWTHSFYSIALDACVRAVLLAGLVSIILAALRVRSSGVAHAAWRGVLFAMLFMPALPYCVPSITIPVQVPFRALDRADAVAKAPAVSPVFETSEAVSIEQLPAIRVAATSVATARPSSMWPLALIVYGIGVLVLLSRLLLGRRFMKRIADASLRIGPELLSGAAAVYECQRVASPMTVGVLFPKIVLPVTWQTWPQEKLDAVLAHELAHVARRDPLIGFLARVNCGIFWFHPLAWWLERKLAATAEHACDDAAVRATRAPHQYAELLIEMAETVRRRGGRLSWQGIGVEGNGLLGQRIDRILRGDIFRELSRTHQVAVGLACIIAVFLAVACRQQPAALQDFKLNQQDVRTAAEEALRQAIVKVGTANPLEKPQQVPPAQPRPTTEAVATANTPAKSLQFSIQVDFVKITEDTVLTPITVHVANQNLAFQEQDGFATARAHVYGQIRTVSGRVVQKFEDDIQVGPIPAALFKENIESSERYQKAVYLKSGLYQLEFVIKDVHGGNSGTATLAFSVPMFTGLATSSLILADSIQDLPQGRVAGMFVLGNKNVYPNVTQEFRRDKNLNIWLQVYGLKIDQATQRSSATLEVVIGLDGGGLRRSFMLAGNSETTTFTQSFPLADFDPGAYSIQIRVTDDVAGESILKVGRFTVQ